MNDRNFTRKITAMTQRVVMLQRRGLNLPGGANDTECRRCQELFDAIPAGYLVTDSAGNIREANRAVTNLLGVRQDFLINKPLVFFLAEADRPAFHSHLARLLQEPGEWVPEWQVELQPSEGLPFPAELTAGLVRSGDGQLTGLHWLLRDITARKQAEVADAQHQETLWQQITDLQARNADLEAYDQTVAHDLGGLLSALVGLASWLVESSPTLTAEELQGHLRDITRRGQKMTRMVRDLLLLAGVRHQDVESQPLDLGGIVADVKQRLAGLIDASQAEFLDDPVEWPVAWGYVPWIEEVWINYLSNAIKYGGRPPQLQMGADANSNGKVRFWVRDNGSGLSLAQQARLFKPFTKLHPGQADGHGLGLSIVRRIVDKLGGQVRVESDGLPGQGSIFSFTLPGVDLTETSSSG